MVEKISWPKYSGSQVEPATFILSVMLWVRSSEIVSQVMPSSRVRKTTLPAK